MCKFSGKIASFSQSLQQRIRAGIIEGGLTAMRSPESEKGLLTSTGVDGLEVDMAISIRDFYPGDEFCSPNTIVRV
jgi:hypothetical protein